MQSYEYISIALRQDTPQGVRSLATLGTGIDAASLVGPEAALQRFVSARDCYVMQSRPEGRYFSYISMPREGGTEPYMITVLVHQGLSLTGAQTLALFGALKRAHAEGRDTAEGLVQALDESGVPRQGVALRTWDYQPPRPGMPVQEAAYRTYASTRELEDIFSFPAQTEYLHYHCLIVVSVTTSLRPGVRMPRITAPVRRQFSVVCPPGVTASKQTVYDGDRLDLTYSCPPFDPHHETVVAGQSAVFAKPEGSTLRVRPAQECGITFTMRVPVKVDSETGTKVSGYTITVNGRNISASQGDIVLTEHDVRASAEMDIQVDCTNYDNLRVLKTPQELMEAAAAGGLTLTLHPCVHGVTLNLDFGEGRVVPVELSIQQGTPEYNKLHSGRFHGYRANRLAAEPGQGETYNVDMRAGKVAPLPQPQSQQGTLKAPTFENVAAPAPSVHHYNGLTPQKPKTQQPQAQQPQTQQPYGQHPYGQHQYGQPGQHDPQRPSGPKIGTNPWMRDQVQDEVEEHVNGRPQWWKNWVVWVAALVIAVVVVAICLPDSSNAGIEEPEEQAIAQGEGRNGGPDAASQLAVEATKGNVQASATDPAPAQAAPQATPQDQAEVAYLNNNNVWKTADMKGAMAASLATAMRNGDLEAVARNPYFAGSTCTNKEAKAVAKMLWEAVGSGTAKANVAKLKEACSGSEIDIHKLYDALSRVKPDKGSANKSQFPG